jgi:hypothetical protein
MKYDSFVSQKYPIFEKKTTSGWLHYYGLLIIADESSRYHLPTLSVVCEAVCQIQDF